MIDSESDHISVDSAESLFSVPSDTSERGKAIREQVMFKLIDDDDLRGADCGLKLVNTQLERGITRLDVYQSTDGGNSDISEEEQ